VNRRKQDLFSVEDEPALGAGGTHQLDPSEAKAARREARELMKSPAEIDMLRDSVLSEPSLDPETRRQVRGGFPEFRDWLLEKKARVGTGALVVVTLLAGIAGGPYSIIGALLQGGVQHPLFFWFYAIVMGPVVEEMLKQSGALFLLERRPWWLKSGWQFPVIALISAALFATIENWIYIAGPLQDLKGEAFTEAVNFRWRYCTVLHIGCSLLASVGMWCVWRRQVRDGAPAQLHHGYRWIVAAVVCHALYNLSVSLFFGPEN
jgi:hypothetical protein